MIASLDTRRIRDATPAEQRDYYVELLKGGAVEDITGQLLKAIEQGLLPPLAFSPWLGVSKSPTIIRDALEQDKSILVRKLGIWRFIKDLSSRRWKETWVGVGGTVGLLNIFSNLSIYEIREICRGIGTCGRGQDLAEKRKLVTELFQGLQPSVFPEATHKSTDQRPLVTQYQLLLPACSEDIVERVVAGDLMTLGHDTRVKHLQNHHSVAMRQVQLRGLEAKQPGTVTLASLKGLVQQYPSQGTPDPKFSASMDFALTVLRKLAESDTYAMEDRFFLKELVQPLLRRAIQKHADWVKIKEITDYMMIYLEAHPAAGHELTLQVGDVRHLVAQCWSRQPQLFEPQLKRLCSHPDFGTQTSNAISPWSNFLRRIPSEKRYQLLRLVFQASTGLDLDTDSDLKKSKGGLGYTLLAAIGEKQALSLFLRLRKARGDEGLVELGPSNSVLRVGFSELYHIVLQGRNGNCEEAERLAESYIEDQKKKAASAAQPEQRGPYAESALFAAITSGSLNILQDILEWNKRFLRDPLTLNHVYPSEYPREAVQLLSGIPPLETAFSTTELRTRVEQANSILTSLFDTACSALQEPSFTRGDWTGVFALFQSVVQRRIELSSQVKFLLKLSEDEIYRALWESTTTMLISVEEKANQEGHERLDANHLRGIFRQRLEDDQVIQHHPKDTSTIRFLDGLARMRDELWRRLRPKRYPTAAMLPTPLPLGLAIQDLTGPWVLDVQDLEHVAPYMESRMKAALFPDPMEALQPVLVDLESRKAIGNFVDSYHYALQLYISKSCSRSVRETRLRQVWEYTTGVLSSGRMSAKEAARFWDTTLSATISETRPQLRDRRLKYQIEWPPRDSVSLEEESLPLIPKVDDPKEPSEWNPFAIGSPTLPARRLEDLTFIDVTLTIPRRSWGGISNGLNLLKPEIPASEINSVLKKRKRLTGSAEGNTRYRRRRYRYEKAATHSSRKTDDGSVLAALLYLDTKFRSSNARLLESAFPQPNDKADIDDFRYPSLYLDEEFLSDETLDPRGTVYAIRGHLNQIPPVLLHQLASNLALALEAAEPTESMHFILQEVATLLVVRLEESDRPSLASEMAMTAILDRPQTSSWHRQLLKTSFLQRLPATEARAIIEVFVKRMLEKLSVMQKQKKRVKDDTTDMAQDYLGSAAIKVSTIKFLAQFLRRTEVVSEDFAFSTLSALFEKSTHIDVRANIIYSLLDMLQYGSKERLDSIITALKPAILLAGNLNEREPATEDDWEQAEKDISNPEVQTSDTISISLMAPVFNQLLSFFGNKSIEPERSQPILEHILLPTLERLKEQTTRWISLFLRRHGFDQATQDGFHIPPIPRHESVLMSILARIDTDMDHTPRVLLEEWVDFMVFRCSPPEPLRAFNKKLRDDPALKSKPDVEEWLALYGTQVESVNFFTNSLVSTMLESDERGLTDSKVTLQFSQKQFMRIFNAVLWNDGPLYNNLHSLVQDFSKHHCLVTSWWKPHGEPMVETLIAEVDKIRTQEWQRLPARMPATLPDTFSWRLLLLDYAWPASTDTAHDREQKCRYFANQLAIVINGMVVHGNTVTEFLYHKHLDALKEFLSLDMASAIAPSGNKPVSLHTELMNNRLLTAIHLGDVAQPGSSFSTTETLLKVHVAIYLVSIVQSMHKVDSELKRRFGELLDSWKMSENESVRNEAYEFEIKSDWSREGDGLEMEAERLKLQAWQREVDLIDYSEDDGML